MKKLSDGLERHIDLLISRYPVLDTCRQDITDAYLILEKCYENDHKLLIAGNGGSAADSEHIAGELMKRFKIARPVPADLASKLKEIDPVRGENLARNLERGLMAIPLVAHEALTTAYINDVDGLGVFAQQLYGFGRPGDVFLGISTSGNSKNVLSATVVARALGIKVIGLTGENGGELAKIADVAIKVPSQETYMIQELHLPVYHCLCLMLVLLVELIYLALYRLIGKENRFNSKFMTLAISCVYIIFVSGNTALFGNVIHALTGKSSDLSTRLIIWKNSFDYISRRPILGGGYTFGDEFQSILGNLHFSSTHNMIVQIMFYGGIALLAVFIYTVVHLVRNVSIIKEQKIAYIVFGIVLMILIEGLTESLVGSVKIYILLQILISFTESEMLYEREVENGGAE